MSRRNNLLPQPPGTGLYLWAADGESKVRLGAEDIDGICDIPPVIHWADLSDEEERRSVINFVMEHTSHRRPRIIYIEVQFALVEEKTHRIQEYAYAGGTATAIGPHHLLTALHILQPKDEWMHKAKGTGCTWCCMRILEIDEYFEMPDNSESLDENERWVYDEGYERVYHDSYLDIALLSTRRTHLVLPLCFDALCYGTKIYTVDVSNYGSGKVFEGRCWIAEDSIGDRYESNAHAQEGFSGGGVVGIVPCLMCLNCQDRYAALVGIVVSDAGKDKRRFSRFVSLGPILDMLKRWNEKWDLVIRPVESKYKNSSKWDSQTPQVSTTKRTRSITKDDADGSHTSYQKPFPPTTISSPFTSSADTLISSTNDISPLVEYYRRFQPEFKGREEGDQGSIEERLRKLTVSGDNDKFVEQGMFQNQERRSGRGEDVIMEDEIMAAEQLAQKAKRKADSIWSLEEEMRSLGKTSAPKIENWRLDLRKGYAGVKR